MAAPIHGGSAMAEAVAGQYLMKARRLRLALRSISPTVSSSLARGMANPRGCKRSGVDARPQFARVGGNLIRRAREYVGDTAHFDEFGDRFVFLVEMLDPPNARESSLVDLRPPQCVDGCLHLPVAEHPLQLG